MMWKERADSSHEPALARKPVGTILKYPLCGTQTLFFQPLQTHIEVIEAVKKFLSKICAEKRLIPGMGKLKYMGRSLVILFVEV